MDPINNYMPPYRDHTVHLAPSNQMVLSNDKSLTPTHETTMLPSVKGPVTQSKLVIDHRSSQPCDLSHALHSVSVPLIPIHMHTISISWIMTYDSPSFIISISY